MSTSLGNSGMQRYTQLIINKKVGGISLSGYPKNYNFLNTFGNFMTITPKELSTMSTAVYQARLNAFKSYVETIETGITVDITFSYQENPSACPFIK